MTISISIPQIEIVINNNQNLNLEQMAHTIDDLIAEVAKTKTLEDGAKTLISGLRQKVADAIASAGTSTSDAELAAIQAKVDETFAQLAASNTDLAGSLVENTPTDGGSTTPPVTAPPADTTGGSTTTPVGTPVDTTGGDTTIPVVDASAPPVVDPTSSVPGAPTDPATGGTAGAPPPPSL